MHRAATWAAPLLLALLTAVPASGQIPKSGEFSVTVVYTGSVVETVEAGGETVTVIEFDELNLNDAGSGFLHNVTSTCRMIAIPGRFHSYCVNIDGDGDSFYSEALMAGGAVGEAGVTRTVRFLGGNGKYAGIEGGYTYEVTAAPKLEGVILGHAKGSGSYTIP